MTDEHQTLIDDHDCLLRAAEVAERTAESVQFLSQGDAVHQALWERIKADSVRLRRMARELSSKVPAHAWFTDARRSSRG